MTPVTVISKETGEVRFADKKRGGDVSITVQYLSTNGYGELSPSGKSTRVDLSKVTVIEGYDFDLMAEYITYQQQTLSWGRLRAIASTQAETRLQKELASDLAQEMDIWVFDNPKPTHPTSIASEVKPEVKPEAKPEAK